jgi:hypothetical protein
MTEKTSNPATLEAGRARDKFDCWAASNCSQISKKAPENQGKYRADLNALCRIGDARLCHLTACIHALGPRVLYELLGEFSREADIAVRLEAYACLDPAILAALCSVVIPAAYRLIGGEP